MHTSSTWADYASANGGCCVWSMSKTLSLSLVHLDHPAAHSWSAQQVMQTCCSKLQQLASMQ